MAYGCCFFVVVLVVFFFFFFFYFIYPRDVTDWRTYIYTVFSIPALTLRPEQRENVGCRFFPFVFLLFETIFLFFCFIVSFFLTGRSGKKITHYLLLERKKGFFCFYYSEEETKDECAGKREKQKNKIKSCGTERYIWRYTQVY